MADEDQPGLFPLYGCWEKPLSDLAETLRRAAEHSKLSAEQRSAMRKLARGIARLPYPTDDLGIEASLSFDGRSLCLSHYGEYFSISTLICWHEAQGSEHEMTKVLEADAGVGHSREGEDPITVMGELEDWASGWKQEFEEWARAAPGVELAIHDEHSEVEPPDGGEQERIQVADAWTSLRPGV